MGLVRTRFFLPELKFSVSESAILVGHLEKAQYLLGELSILDLQVASSYAKAVTSCVAS
jgi:hypothetical protein